MMTERTIKSDFKLYIRLLSFVKPYIPLFALSILGYIILSSSQPMLANIMRYFIDSLNDKATVLFPHVHYLNQLNLVYSVPLLLVLISVWQGVGSFIGGYFLSKVSLNLVQDIRLAMFNKFLDLPSSYFDEQNSGSIAAGVVYAANSITAAATNAIQIVFREGLTVVFLLGYLLYMNWRLTLVLFLIFPIIINIVRKTGKTFRKQSLDIQQSMGAITHVAGETILNYRVVKVFGGTPYENNRFVQATDESLALSLNMVKTSAIYTPKLQIILYTAMAALLFLILSFKGDASIGQLIAYITAVGLLPKSIRQLSGVSSTIQKGLAGAESIFGLLDQTTEIDEGKIEKQSVKGKLEVINLAFAYPNSNRQILNNINFSAEPGQMIALVGKSGSGKSTLASLLLRFYHHSEGKILLDGIEINDYKLANLRQHMALVTQQVTLFNDTIFRNIAYGELASASLEEVKEAAKLAYAHEFIEALPEGYHTVIGENGVKLSGGQRQRLAIARAFLKNAPLLILDEATSALDNESERYIQAALDNIMVGRTTLVIAHRLSTIEKADKILVMSDGEIVESGTHEALLLNNAAYAKLYLNDDIENTNVITS